MSCSVLQACFPRTNIILIYNATKDKAGFLILISDSLIISSIKTVMSFRFFFHVLFWFGTETAQRSISAPWVTWFISSFIDPSYLLESTLVLLKDFWTSWTGLAAVSNQRLALVSITLYQVIDLWDDNVGRGSEALSPWIVTKSSPRIANSSPSQQTATQDGAGEPVSRTPAQCISRLQTLAWCAKMGWKTWNEMWSPLWDFLLAFQFLCKICAILFTVSSFKVVVTIRLKNSKHTKNGIFCVKMSHWNSDTSFSQSVQHGEANRAQTLLGKNP